VKDRGRRVYADPAKVHDVHHEGKHFNVHGCHLCEPSPQRTPVLYQAGASPRGRQFAARHAECVFVSGPSPNAVGSYVRDTRERARELGRAPEDLFFFMYMKVVTGGTEAEARRKYDDFLQYVDDEAALTLLSGWSGIDFGRFTPDQPIEYIETNAIRTLFQNIAQANPSRRRTMRDVAKAVGIGGGGPVLVGAPEQIVDAFGEWLRAGVDGFNLAYAITPGSYEDFVDGVVPVLQRRGLMQKEYGEGTLREKLYGKGHARLLDRHPGSRCRRRGESSAGKS
jgi:long-chain alkane monooxygenase